MEKELKKGKLYLLEIEYGCEREDGSMYMAKSLLVGYVVCKEDKFFYGSIFDRFDDGRYDNGGTMSLSTTEFNDYVKSIKEIA